MTDIVWARTLSQKHSSPHQALECRPEGVGGGKEVRPRRIWSGDTKDLFWEWRRAQKDKKQRRDMKTWIKEPLKAQE